jgi:hypothetical protein
MAAQALSERAGEECLPGIHCQRSDLGLAAATDDGPGLREQGTGEIGVVSLTALNLLIEQVQIRAIAPVQDAVELGRRSGLRDPHRLASCRYPR